MRQMYGLGLGYTKKNLLRSTEHGLSTAWLLREARAIFGPPVICKWEGLPGELDRLSDTCEAEGNRKISLVEI